MLCTGDTIPVAVQSHRQFDVETVNLDEADPQQYSPHVFEVEPSSSPLRIVFSSESSPLTLDVEKIFRDTPMQAHHAPDVKQDRSGVVGPDASPVNSAEDKVAPGGAGSSAINEDEYEIVEQYSRIVPVKVRDNAEEVLSGSDDDVVFVKPEKVIKIGVSKPKAGQAKVKKVVKIPVIKATAKPAAGSAAKVVATKPTARTTVATTKATRSTVKTTPAEEMTTPVSTTGGEKEKVKFGARLTRHTHHQQQQKKDKKKQKNDKEQKRN